MLTLYQTLNEVKDNGGKDVSTPCLSMRYGKSKQRFTFEGQDCSRTDKMRMVCAKMKTSCYSTGHSEEWELSGYST